MKNLIITAVGTDKPGLVNKITSIINENNGNIDNSKMIKIKDQFAMIIDFYLSSNLNEIKNQFSKIKDLKISYMEIKKPDSSKNNIKTYLIKGADDQGIINKISEYLSNKNINIIEVDTFINAAPITGAPLFNLKITIENNQLINFNELNVKLTNICDNLNLDIKLL